MSVCGKSRLMFLPFVHGTVGTLYLANDRAVTFLLVAIRSKVVLQLPISLNHCFLFVLLSSLKKALNFVHEICISYYRMILLLQVYNLNKTKGKHNHNSILLDTPYQGSPKTIAVFQRTKNG